jgi:DNA-binding FadR family transcriptional regulator
MARAEDFRLEPPVASMRVPKVAELVANDLRRKIIRGQLPVGDTLPNEPTLLELYHVSRPTLREALRILESEGLVSIKRGAQGGQVHVPDVSVAARHVALQMQVRGTTIEDLFAARRVIEPGAVRMLAESASSTVVAALREQLDAERPLLDKPNAYATAATRFHEMLVELTGNNTLTIMSELVLAIVDRHHHETFARASGLEREYTQEASEHHAHVVDLIEQREAEEAESFWRFHVEGGAARALRHLGPTTIVDLLA